MAHHEIAFHTRWFGKDWNTVRLRVKTVYSNLSWTSASSNDLACLSASPPSAGLSVMLVSRFRIQGLGSGLGFSHVSLACKKSQASSDKFLVRISW